MTLCEKAIKAIRDEKVCGWLFYNFGHRDPLADKILAVSPATTNSRPWIYLLFKEQDPIKIVHRIEDTVLDHLPGEKHIYTDRNSFYSVLKKCAGNTPEVALHYSMQYPQLSFIDHGTVLLLSHLGFKPYPAHNLIQQVLSTLSGDELKLHEQASGILHSIVHEVWTRIRTCFLRNRSPVYEGEIQHWILDLFKEKGLVTDSPLIVGTGKNTALPHYFPHGRGAKLQPAQLVQLDLWGKLDTPRGIYADISWVGILASSVPDNIKKIFNTIIEARDATVEYIANNLRDGKTLSGSAVDMHAEKILQKAGFADYIKHRTGHAIDSEVHGFGVNLDAKEFPDTRLLKEGSCFSIEPGLYFSDFGMRTEIDVYIKDGRPIISGASPQTEILTL
ncbi:MAG: aminopeptidase P family protein [Spirochaetales bacterium]|nr:aminopeptidase P family protein [Spirochaetales bacterium]